MTRERVMYIATIIGLIFFSITQCERAIDSEAKATAYDLDNSILREEALVWQEKDSTWRAEKKTFEASLASLEYSHALKIDELMERIDGLKNTDQIRNVLVTSTSTKGSFETPALNLNLSCNHTFNFENQDRWSSFLGSYDNGIVSLNYEVKDSITYVDYWKRPGFLKRKVPTIHGISHNPNTTIYGLNNISIKVPRPIVTVNAGIGVTYYDGQVRYFPSITIGKHLFTIYSRAP